MLGVVRLLDDIASLVEAEGLHRSSLVLLDACDSAADKLDAKGSVAIVVHLSDTYRRRLGHDAQLLLLGWRAPPDLSCCLNHVQSVVGTKGLEEYVVIPASSKEWTNRTASNNTSTLECRLNKEQNLRSDQ